MADPVPLLTPDASHFDMLCECVKQTLWQKGVQGQGGEEHT